MWCDDFTKDGAVTAKGGSERDKFYVKHEVFLDLKYITTVLVKWHDKT